MSLQGFTGEIRTINHPENISIHGIATPATPPSWPHILIGHTAVAWPHAPIRHTAIARLYAPRVHTAVTRLHAHEHTQPSHGCMRTSTHSRQST